MRSERRGRERRTGDQTDLRKRPILVLVSDDFEVDVEVLGRQDRNRESGLAL